MCATSDRHSAPQTGDGRLVTGDGGREPNHATDVTQSLSQYGRQSRIRKVSYRRIRVPINTEYARRRGRGAFPTATPERGVERYSCANKQYCIGHAFSFILYTGLTQTAPYSHYMYTSGHTVRGFLSYGPIYHVSVRSARRARPRSCHVTSTLPSASCSSR